MDAIEVDAKIRIMVEDKHEPWMAALLAQALRDHATAVLEVVVEGLSIGEPSLQGLIDQWLGDGRITTEVVFATKGQSIHQKELVELVTCLTRDNAFESQGIETPELNELIDLLGFGTYQKKNVRMVLRQCFEEAVIDKKANLRLICQMVKRPEFKDNAMNLREVGLARYTDFVAFVDALISLRLIEVS